MESALKNRTARSVKWNLIDRLTTQLLYGVTGVILANVLSKEDFGLVGAIMVFQAFASLFVDSGFSYALIQRKHPSKLDYSTVLWFNVGMACAIYILLFFAAPLISLCFGGDQRLVPLSRVMLLSFIINATAIVQTNRLMKLMDVRMVAASNALGLTAGAIAGIWLAIQGFGAWALVWQSIVISAVKSIVLWTTTRWRPMLRFSMGSLRSFFSVGAGMMTTSLLNTIFQNIYALLIGMRAGLVPLGYYTQADKWSKMGVTTISQTVTSAFLPGLSHVQDDPSRFIRVATKMNRFTAYVVLPFMGFLIVCATPVFHCLFGTKWDAAVPLFQLLLLRGVFTVMVTLYNNFLIALARTREVVRMETLRDVTALVFLAVCFPIIGMTTPENPVKGIEILLWGQVAASAITWAVMIARMSGIVGRRLTAFLADYIPYTLLTVMAMAFMALESNYIADCWQLLAAQAATGLAIYIGANAAMRSHVQSELLAYIFKKRDPIQ